MTLQVSINPSGVDPWLEIVAWATVATVLGLLWVARTYLRYRAADAGERRHIRSLRPQFLRGTSVTVRVTQGFDTGDVRRRILDAFDRDEGLEEDDATVRDVARELAAAVANARPEWVPVLAWRGVLEAGLLLVVGLVAYAPLAYWRAAVDSSLPTSGGALETLQATIDLVVAGLAAFPFAGGIRSLLLASGILGIRGIWGSWLLPAVLLVAGAVALTRLDGRIREWDDVPDDVVLIARWRAVGSAVVWLVLVWATGVLVATPWRYVGESVAEAGNLVGVITAAAVGAYGVTRWIRSLRARTRGYASISRAETGAVLAYMVLRRAYLAVAIVVAGLSAGYLAEAAATGRLSELAAILAGAPAWVLASLGLGVVSLVVIAALQVPSVLEDVRDILGRVSRSAALRLWVFARGVPIVGTVAAFALVLALFASLWKAIAAAVATGAILRVVGAVLVRAKYAALKRASGWSRPVAEVHVSPYSVVDADDETLWVVDVDGTRLVHRDRDQLVDDAIELLEERTTTGESVATESEHYADRVDMGLVDVDRFRSRLRAETRLETKVRLRGAGGEADEESLLDSLTSDYPRQVVLTSIEKLRRKGDVDKRSGRLVLLE